jgi:glycosyltransferase involved in cell wall biosynthesis
LRVLQICHSYYPPFLDCARQYSALFNNTAYKVLTVYLTGEYSEEVVHGSASDEVIFLGYKSKQVSGLKLGAIAKIKKIVTKEPFLFVIAHRAKPTYVALLGTDLPVISVHHNYNDYSKFNRRILVNFFKKRMLMLGVSDSVRDDLRRDLKSWHPEQIQTLYNRIDVTATQNVMVNKAEARQALNLPAGAWVIGNVGRLHHDKDQATLIEGFAKALPQLPANSLLFIAGKGPLEDTLKQQVAKLKLQSSVIFAGNVPDAKRYFKAFDIFALTSDREPFGMVLLEAMAAGLPIICSDCGGGAEIVRDVGALFPFGDADALANCIIKQCIKVQKFNNAQTKSRLEATFSDQAVKNQFWNMAFIQAIKND